MKNTINISDFGFFSAGFGHYNVVYTSPITGKKWHKIIDNMPLIDRTKNSDDPKRKDLENLKSLVKN